MPVKVSTIIPTRCRVKQLRQCLRALAGQTLPPAQVIVTVRKDDTETWNESESLAEECGPALELVAVDPGPLTAAMNAGLRRATGDLIALTDDDAEPRGDWLERLTAPFDDLTIGGVGGRDWQPVDRGDEQTVGQVSWFGRVVGNHHLGLGPARDVQLLKGVNCCFRAEPLRRIGFDRRLRGVGNVNHWEMSLCFAFVREGWRLVYDPEIAVDHHVAVRHDGDINARGGFDPSSYLDGVHNETLAVLEYLSPSQRAVHLAWAALIGTRGTPGLAQLPRLLALGESPGRAVRRLELALRGRVRGTVTYMKPTPRMEISERAGEVMA